MTKKLVGRGRHTVLPIVGDTLTEVRLSTMSLVALVLRADDDTESELRIEDQITLGRGESHRVLKGSKPGSTFNPRELGPLLELLGCEVVDALADREGRLQISFSNKLVLEITSSTAYEAWHFHYPRSGRPPGGPLGHPITVVGARGSLICAH